MESHLVGWRTFAVLGLALYAVGLLLAFGARAWWHFRRTGDWGIRRVSSTEPFLGRLGAGLFGASLAMCALGLIIGAVVPAWRLPIPNYWAWVGLAACVAGLLAVVASQLAMGTSWRVGVDPQERTELVTDGPFAWVRNPIFTAIGATLVGLALMVPNWVVLLALVLFVVGVQLQVRLVEEPHLITAHGDAYLYYARRTGRFVPGLGRLVGTRPGESTLG
ncbi:methyltransferase family protein [Propionibacteriaceae bacterium G57]|uniref:methyltransferase family protein n=1 Tax=Aestuariimicrobium sp. G57 TaxID=3418485 RepID=UPI003DA7A1F4